MPIGRRERAKQDKRERIMAAARELFAERGVGGVTTQQVADRADVAIGTLYLYAATKAELLIMVQHQKFAAAIDNGLAAAAVSAGEARSRTSSRSSAPWWRACVGTSRTGALIYTSLSSGIPPSPTDMRDSPSQPDSRTASPAYEYRSEATPDAPSRAE